MVNPSIFNYIKLEIDKIHLLSSEIDCNKNKLEFARELLSKVNDLESTIQIHAHTDLSSINVDDLTHQIKKVKLIIEKTLGKTDSQKIDRPALKHIQFPTKSKLNKLLKSVKSNQAALKRKKWLATQSKLSPTQKEEEKENTSHIKDASTQKRFFTKESKFKSKIDKLIKKYKGDKLRSRAEEKRKRKLLLPDESIKDCFGITAYEKINSKTSDNEIIQLIFDFAKQRLANPLPLDENEITKIYHLLFETNLTHFSEKEQDPYHPAKVFHTLMECVKGFQKNGSEAKKTTGEGNTFSGVNGSYFILNETGKKMMVFKPENEEKEGIAKGIKAGEGAKREHLACVLNYDRIFPIPFTCYVQFQGQNGSGQIFLNNSRPLNLLRFSPDMEKYTDTLPKRDLQASLVFDILFENLDRHLGNLMCRLESEDGIPQETFMIDHGLCIPALSGDSLKIEQLGLPQMKESWDESLVKFLLNFDIDKTCQLMEKHGIHEEAIKRTRRAANFLQEGLKIVKASEEGMLNLSLYDLGLIVLKNQDHLWTDTDAEKLLKLITFIPPLKQKIVNENPSKAKMTLMRRNFVKEHPEFNDTQISCLFGASPQDETQERIDWSISILGTQQER